MKFPRSATRTGRFRPRLEELETRLVLSGYEPSATEQLFLEQLNDARANPPAYGASVGVDLSNVAASQPLAFNPLLVQTARDHSLDMNAHNYFGHNSYDGYTPGQRMTAAGFYWQAYGESIAAGYDSTAEALKALIIDNGIPDLGHRRHLLAIDSAFKTHTQVGIGVVLGGSGTYGNYYTIDTGVTSDRRPFVTGVVFKDLNNNGRYDIGEGLGGVSVAIAGVASTSTFGSGGYSLQVSAGTYTVTASGGPLAATVSQVVSVGSLNVRLNFNPPALPAPTPTSPGGTISTLMPTFSWTAVDWASSYEVWVNDVTTGQSQVLDQGGLTGTSWTATTSLTPGHNYRWWVQASSSSSSMWSAGQDFTISVTAPTPVGPSGSTTSLRPTFSWNSVSWADHYEVWVNDLTTGQGKVLNPTGLTGSSWTSGADLTLGHSYRWWVQGLSSSGSGLWSTSRDFSLTQPTPTPVGPGGPVSTMQPTFSWNGVSWADHYEVWVDDLTAGQSKVLNQSGLTGSSWTPATTMTAGHDYRWWVQALPTTGAGVWSSSQDLSIVIAAPTPVGPSGSITALRPTFSWNSVSWADRYEVWVNDLTTGQSKVLNPSGLTGSSWTPGADLTLGHSYRWWVQGLSSSGSGLWSTSRDFSITKPTPTLVGPGGSVSTMQPTFSWNGVSWADHYEVWVDDLTAGQSRVLNQSGLTGTSWTSATSLTAGHTYRWWVQALPASGSGLWSASQDFTIVMAAPTIVAPANGGSTSTVQPTFSWNGVSWANQYEVWVDDLSTGQSKVLDQTGLTGSSWTSTTALTAGHRYRWWVKGSNSSGSGIWSGAQEFWIY